MTLRAQEIIDPPTTLEATLWENHVRMALLKELDAYTRWLYERVRPFIHGEVCEVGCGTGNIIQFLLHHPRVVGLEPFEPSLEKARRLFDNHLNVRFYGYWLSECPNRTVRERSFDTVLCMNVLEHIENDVDALRRMGRLCRSDGQVVILVPAHMFAFGGMDRAAGHFRRYNRRTLQRAFEAADLEIVHSFYMNALGLFGWWWYARVLGREELPARPARWFNRLVPILDGLERLLRLPFGQSLVMVGRPIRGEPFGMHRSGALLRDRRQRRGKIPSCDPCRRSGRI
ncbi:MAG: class I SAM-dependent methyltransferase [Planctomycetota bacterium]|nr:MAG: class I SAM-dependent methyltransferase [Planctomycetota bacterium]